MNTLLNVLKRPKVFWQRLFYGFEKAIYAPITHKTHYYFLAMFACLCCQPLAAQTITGTVTPGCTNNGTITVNIPASITLSAVRHIRIQMNKNDYLHLGELRAFEVGTGTNVALNKTATSFSNWSGHLPSYLVDGDVNTLGHSANAGTQEFLEVDLGATYLIDRIEIVNRGNCCQDRADNLLLILKDNSGTTINSRQIDAYQGQNNAYTSTWNVTDVSWADGATTLNRTGLAAGNYTINYSDVNSVTAQQTFNVPNASVPSVSIVSNDADNTIIAGTSVTFTATPTNGGTTPSYQWKKNGNDVGTNSATYTDAALVNNDVITVVMTSNAACISPTTATSNSITMTVTTTPAITGTVTPTCNNNGAITVTIPTSITLSAVRHIRIQMNKNDYLHLGELRAFEVGTGTNVALNKTVTSFSDWSGHLPGYLVDGDENTLGHSANAGTQEFLEVDLGATYLIDRIEIVNRGDCCQERADNLLLILKDNSGTTINSRQINASTSVTTSWNVTDVSWADGATTLNRTGLAAGNYTINYSDVNSVTAQQTFNVTSLASPTLFNVTGNNGFSCNGTGVAIGLSNSETGVNYQLKRGGTDVGSVVAGTNAALNFGNQTVSGTYTVVATHATSGCTATMTGSATITVENSTLTPSVTIVSNDADNSIILNTSVTFTATPTNGGTTPSYQWKKNGNNVGTNSTTYTDAALANNDVISCVLTSANACASPTTATSNNITMTVIDPCAGITNNRIYVKIGGTGNGASWANALGNLQDALHNTCGATEIWVAAGTYLPTKDPFGNASPTDPRDKTFYVKDGIRLYGGFAGTETQLSQRNITANPTILSGDIGTLNDNSDNCYHVIVLSGQNSGNAGTTISGFTIRKGYSTGGGNIIVNGNSISRNSGSGIFINKGNNTLTHNTITEHATGVFNRGTGISNQDGNNTFISNIFSNNTGYNGGGLFSLGGTNLLVNNIFYSNSVSSTGGGASLEGGTNTITNNTFYGNNGGGGALFTMFSNCTITNNIFWGNGTPPTATSSDYRTFNSTNTFKNNVLQLASSSYTSGNINALGSGSADNIFATNPLFTNAANGDFTLQAGSPCINAGNNTAWTATGLTTDFAGTTRPIGVVDIGAYEYQAVLPIALISFTGKPTEGGNLLSWQTAEEQNAAHFDMERSLDGKNFTKIGQVKAKGSYSQYEFLDDKNNATILYYRLKMNDLDGKFAYSKIISIVKEGKNKVKIYPSVTADNITIEGAKSAEIVNMTGQVVIQQSQLSNSTISLQHLPSGVYFVRGEATEGGYFVEKIIKD